MAVWGRPHAFKVAFILCILLLLLLNFSNFRSNSQIRTPTPLAIGTQWPMPLHPKTKSNNNNYATSGGGNGTTSAINQNQSNREVTFKRNENATPRTHSNQFSINSSKLSASMPSIRLESIKLPQNVNETTRQTNGKNEIPNFKTTATTIASTQSNVKSPFFTKLMTKFGLNTCPKTPPNLIGPINVDAEYSPLSSIENQFRTVLLPGGWYKPHECNAIDRIAIVVPYRDRAEHLPIFLKNIHPLLMKQQIEYGIFVIEQIDGDKFNRAALLNIGFLEALKLHNWDCFIFHDVDLIPLDDRNLYRCPEKQPRHMSVAVDTMGFKLPYYGIFGGVSAMTVKQFQTVNGFSNSFWGWGGEDDDMSYRLRHVGYHISRYPVNIARYKMLTHRKEKANPKRYEQLVSGVKKFDSDGINSVKYEVRTFERKVLYTWILVDVKHESITGIGMIKLHFFVRMGRDHQPRLTAVSNA